MARQIMARMAFIQRLPRETLICGVSPNISLPRSCKVCDDWLDRIKWDGDGLVPAIAQEKGSGKVLMMAWMNRQALALTRKTGHAVYWSRSRGTLWHKGESSGHQQIVHRIRLDCDADVILMEVEQKGGIACHTGRHACFFRELRDDRWVDVEPVLKDPADIYGR
jgi:phosphoribosyl-AMP cyclohydrolase